MNNFDFNAISENYIIPLAFALVATGLTYKKRKRIVKENDAEYKLYFFQNESFHRNLLINLFFAFFYRSYQIFKDSNMSATQLVFVILNFTLLYFISSTIRDHNSTRITLLNEGATSKILKICSRGTWLPIITCYFFVGLLVASINWLQPSKTIEPPNISSCKTIIRSIANL